MPNTLTLPMIQRVAKSRGIGEVEEIINTALILHEGLDGDTTVWAVRLKGGKVKLLTMAAGGLYEMTDRQISDKISQTRRSLYALEELRAILAVSNEPNSTNIQNI